ncbi:polysaccharide lyase family 1 protein [Pseudomonas syringae pv. tagetis]|uniref:pectin lyase n=1 Tax=Pseudomonas syringae pv. tagetis TaxID=129140 RepID=A0A0Q0GV81_9PSED|nr:polysaccharide lyase family 1 protein [Pseudomonas syringae group genomosp. 7]KPY80889.1 Pectin lyase [Pseudomonas syringae pv. tagetis]RMW12023.1 Pectin lyase [Pseudomonas syringae pv. tagetis]RMW20230.1 Pectin lyase [Pseudomonas syringae pv. tagetis]UNB67542.1 polysaccharide lyase family 1 protein [Pseudomonas syringae pv. tagetis]
MRPVSALFQCVAALFLMCSLEQHLQAAEAPEGFAKGVTGGGAATAVHPSTLDELRSALCASRDSRGACTDETPRVIVLDHVFDFRRSVVVSGSTETTEPGCVVKPCPHGGEQFALNGANNFCQSRPPVMVTYDNAGLKPLKVGSNKTLIGVGNKAGIQGAGLFIGDGAHNVIVRNLTLSDINPSVVWGGDALTLNKADGIWIDHNTFARIGRQMIVTGWGAASHVTLSSNEFDGRTPYSSTCDGHHYWVWLFLGNQDTLTLSRNYIHDGSGRAPHSGGMKNAQVHAQLVNNVFQRMTYQGAIMSRTPSSQLLVEGNDFEKVTHPLFNDVDQPGNAFALFDPGSAGANDVCMKTIGRACVANQQRLSGDDYRPQDASVLNAFREYRQFLLVPMPPEQARVQVPRDAGVGKIDVGTMR